MTTVEGVGTEAAPHPLQTRLASCHGVQCGYDSPGIIMSAFSLLVTSARPSPAQLESAMAGNLSRCNGYRAVLEAFQVFTEKENEDRVRLEAGLPLDLQGLSNALVLFCVLPTRTSSFVFGTERLKNHDILKAHVLECQAKG